jgi:hypothetical protein
VAIAVTVRRFRCDNSLCERRIFVERLPKVMGHILGEAIGSLRFSGISEWRLVVPQVGGWPIVLPCQ